MKKALSLLSVIGASVSVVFAQVNVTIGQTAQQGQINDSAITGLLGSISKILSDYILPITVSLAVLALFWFLITYIWLAKDKPDDQAKATKGIALSILALFVMVSIWGLIGFIGSTLGISQGGGAPIPQIPRARQ